MIMSESSSAPHLKNYLNFTISWSLYWQEGTAKDGWRDNNLIKSSYLVGQSVHFIVIVFLFFNLQNLFFIVTPPTITMNI